MGNLQNFPYERAGISTTAAVVDLIAALAPPPIQPFATDILAMELLPLFPDTINGSRVPGTDNIDGEGFQDPDTSAPTACDSQLDYARRLMDDCISSIDALNKHQNRCAGMAAVLIDRLASSIELEAGILSLDAWQQKNSLSSMAAELAAVLQLPEGSANSLMLHSTTLVRQLPATMQHLHSGELGWDHAVIIAEETSLLRVSGVSEEATAAFELILLGKAQNCTIPSFREKSRRLRERRYPESLVPRTRKEYADRRMTKSRARDGMSWLSFYAPAPTVEGIWDQCTATAQAAQGPHESRTLAQLRLDVAAAMLLNQSLAENDIYAPSRWNVPEPAGAPGRRKVNFEPNLDVPSCDTASVPTPTPTPTGDVTTSTDGLSNETEGVASARSYPERKSLQETGGRSPQGLQNQSNSHPGASAPGPVAADESDDPGFDEGRRYWWMYPWNIPVFDDPDYRDSNFKEPDPRNEPDWIPGAAPPTLNPLPGFREQTVEQSGRDSTQPGTSETTFLGAASHHPPWPPLPRVLPIVVVPVLSMLGATTEPAWMEGVGPISIEVAKELTANAPSLYRLLVDPIHGKPLDIAPESYRITKALRTMIRVRDEYCQFPGCTAKACSSEIDHIRAFEAGGETTLDNLESLCLHHHLLKHFRDDKNKDGTKRIHQDPQRARFGLRGWTPVVEDGGHVSWRSPTGRFFPSDPSEPMLMHYPQWLRTLVDQALMPANGDHLDCDYSALAEDPLWNPSLLPEEPSISRPSAEEAAIMEREAILRGLSDPDLGRCRVS